MFSLARLPTVALAVMMALCLIGTARADPITFTSGTPGTSNYRSAEVAITVVNGVITFTVVNVLNNDQVWSVGQNISGLYFTVNSTGSGYLDSSSGNGTIIESPRHGTPTGELLSPDPVISPTGWALSGDGTGNFALCVICSPTNPAAGPSLTIVGGTGIGDYIHANGSLDNNTPHNPFLAGEVVFTMHIDGVDSASDFSNVIFQFGTDATDRKSVV